MEVLPAEFARQAGVTRQSICAKIKKGTLIQNSAGKLDTENPVNAGYLAMKRRQLEETQAANAAITAQSGGMDVRSTGGQTHTLQKPFAEQTAARAIGVPAELLTLTLKELVMRYSGVLPLEKHAKILKILVESAEKEQRIKERRLTLVDKDFVVSRLFQFTDNLMVQLLEYPESAADNLVAQVLADTETARKTVANTMKTDLSKILAGAKEHIIRELNGLKHKYHDDSAADTIADLKQEIKNELEAEQNDE